MASKYAGKKILVIVESPAKSKIIAKYLEKILPSSSRVFVEASFGHVRDLVKRELGVRLDDGTYACQYTVDANKAHVVEKLMKLARSCDHVMLASDNDREGEAIAWHLREVLKVRESGYTRIVFNEITEKALEEAVSKPLKIDMDLVHAQQTRRIIDRIVGFKLSPLLWGQFKVNAAGGGGLSAGRVQSAVLNIILDREREIQAHTSTAFWTVKGAFVLGGSYDIEEAKLVNNKDDAAGGIARFESAAETRKFLGALSGKFRVLSSRLHDSRESPDAPFVTSTLQQEAYNKLGFGVKQTMGVAQKLYEMGLITYMRTDSYALSKDAIGQVAKYVEKAFGADYVQSRDYSKSKRVKNSQEAHEAIRPTNVFKDGSAIRDANLKRLYELIRNRTIASQMAPVVKAVLDLMIEDSDMGRKFKGMAFKGSTSVVKFPGYLAAWGITAQSTKKLDELAKACATGDAVNVECKGVVAKNGWTSAPQRFNESSLVKVLEREGLGRPSTYASILEKLYEKNYVVVQDVVGEPHVNHDMQWNPKNRGIVDVRNEVPAYADKSRLVPTDIGKAIHSYLSENFADLIDATFTAGMEEKLDEVASGEVGHIDVISGFWGKLEPRVAAAESSKKRHKDRTLLSNETNKIKVGDKEFSVRIGRFGPFAENLSAEKGASDKYIALKPYLTLVKKNYTELEPNEIGLLSKMPLTISGTDATLKYGRYGFYIVNGSDTFTVPIKFIKEIGGPLKLLELKQSDIAVLIEMKKAYFERKAEKKSATPKTNKPKKSEAKAASPRNKDKYNRGKKTTTGKAAKKSGGNTEPQPMFL